MKSKILLSIVMISLFMPSILLGGDGSMAVSGLGVLFGTGIFLIILVCFFIAMKIFSMLRGGEMASGWQVLAISFIILCLGQLVELASSLELFSLDLAFVVAIRLIGVFMLLVGIMRIKKVLS
jgi:hypothetical protein